MSGIQIIQTLEGLDVAIDFAARLENEQLGELRDSVGVLIEGQTKRRIRDEKTSPDGSPWPDNGRDNPIMVESGALADSIFSSVSGEEIQIGTPLIYGAQRHFGGIIKAKNAPRLVFSISGKTVAVPQVEQLARPFLGLSSENSDELEMMLADYLGGLVQ